MISCLVELFGIDGASSYNHAFTFLRALAVALRTALVTGSDAASGGPAAARAAIAAIASWATLNALRALTAIVTAHGATPEAPLWELVYPLAQVLSGLPRAAPAPSHYPLRLHAAALLTELQWATGIYAPVALPLLDVLRCRALTRKPRGAAPSRPTALNLMLRVGATASDTKAYQDALVARVLELLLDAMRAYFASPALPEVVAPVVVQLRLFAADTRVPPWKARARALIDTLVGASSAVAARRATLPFAPADTPALAAFMSKEAAALRSARALARSTALAAELDAAKVEALNPKPLPKKISQGVASGGGGGAKKKGGDESEDSADDSAAEREADNNEDADNDDDNGSDDDASEEEEEEEEDSAPRVPAPTFKRLKSHASDSRGRFKILPKAGGDDEVADIDDF